MRPGARLVFHDWWMPAPVAAVIAEIGPDGSHSNWLESLPWTRVPGVEPPVEQKPVIDPALVRDEDPTANRILLEDGSYGGIYRRSDEEMFRLWEVAVAGVRQAVEDVRA